MASTGRPPATRRPIMRMRVHGFELPHDGLEGADAGDNEPVSIQDVNRFGTEDDLGTGPLQRADRRADVAGAIVQHRHGGLALRRSGLGASGGVYDGPAAEDRAAHRAPLVDGMPSTRGSGSTAARRARAKALNWASTMWWGSRPAVTFMCRQIPAWSVMASKT